jgi:hypothetical protein
LSIQIEKFKRDKSRIPGYHFKPPKQSQIKRFFAIKPIEIGLSSSEELAAITATCKGVQPLNAGFTLDLKDWADDPERTYVKMLMLQLGYDLAEREYNIMDNGMINCAGTTINAAQKGKLSQGDIIQTQNWIAEQGANPDSFIMHINQKVEFEKNGELLYSNKIPLGCVPQEKRGVHCALVRQET